VVLDRLRSLYRGIQAQDIVGYTKGEKFALALCTGLYLIPIWLFTYFPTQDGPTHLENAMILAQYCGAEGGLWHQYYSINTPLVPTWLNHLALTGLFMIMPPLIAEKFFLTGYIVSMVLSFRYFLRCLNWGASFCTVLIFPFLYNCLLHSGFYSFSYSFIPYLILIGYFFRYRSVFDLRKAVLFFILSLLVYLLHPVSFIMALVFVVALFFLDGVAVVRSEGTQADKGRKFLRNFVPVLAMLFILILVVLFVSGRQPPKGGYLLPSLRELARRTVLLLTFSHLMTYHFGELALTMALSLLSGLLLVRGGRALFSAHNSYRSLIVVVLLYGAMYLLLPNYLFRAGGGALTNRLALFTILLFLAWLGANYHLWRLRLGLQICTYGVAFGLLVFHSAKYAELNDYLNEYVSVAAHVLPETTLLPLSLAHHGRSLDGKDLTKRTHPFLHAAGFISVERRVVEFTNYEAATYYFPLVFRQDLNPYVQLGDIESPLTLKSLEFPHGSGGSIDYILVWGLKVAADHPDKVEALMKLVKERYELVYVSRPRGLAELWRNKDFARYHPDS
jgi:hypothetical protein